MKIPVFLLATLILGGNAHAESGSPDKNASDTIYVEVSGNVPGFTQADLAKYLASRMQQSEGASWHFLPGNRNASPNRVSWTFKTLKVVWKGGSHKGFPSPSHSLSYLKAEAKLYLNGEYQMTIDAHPSALNGDESRSISSMASQAAHAFFLDTR